MVFFTRSWGIFFFERTGLNPTPIVFVAPFIENKKVLLLLLPHPFKFNLVSSFFIYFTKRKHLQSMTNICFSFHKKAPFLLEIFIFCTSIFPFLSCVSHCSIYRRSFLNIIPTVHDVMCLKRNLKRKLFNILRYEEGNLVNWCSIM